MELKKLLTNKQNDDIIIIENKETYSLLKREVVKMKQIQIIFESYLTKEHRKAVCELLVILKVKIDNPQQFEKAMDTEEFVILDIETDNEKVIEILTDMNNCDYLSINIL